MFIGSILGLALSPHMIQSLGWPSVFYVFGSWGVVWYTVWNKRAASTPAEDPLLSQAEKVCEITTMVVNMSLVVCWRMACWTL